MKMNYHAVRHEIRRSPGFTVIASAVQFPLLQEINKIRKACNYTKITKESYICSILQLLEHFLDIFTVLVFISYFLWADQIVAMKIDAKNNLSSITVSNGKGNSFSRKKLQSMGDYFWKINDRRSWLDIVLNAIVPKKNKRRAPLINHAIYLFHLIQFRSTAPYFLNVNNNIQTKMYCKRSKLTSIVHHADKFGNKHNSLSWKINKTSSK